MHKDAIYLVSDTGELQRVEHQLYASEDILQELVARHPDLLAGDQIDPDAPLRWLLLRREAAIPDAFGGEDRWWLDHLLLDQFGVPTLVEVKRSTDTRIRREVIGQMLDYIANAQAYWAAGRMRQMLVDECGSTEAADRRLSELLRLAEEPEVALEESERFWQKVEANLREGNVRLLFVADELPRELRRLIEFLNEQFTKIEVLGVELRQYVGQGIKALVPRVIGQTEAAREQKDRSSPNARSPGASLPTNRETFLAAIAPTAVPFLIKVFEQAEKGELRVTFGSKGFSIRVPNRPVFFYCFPPGTNARADTEIEIFLRDIGDPLRIEEMRKSYLEVPGIKPTGKFTLRLPLSAATLTDATRLFELSLDLFEQQRSDPKQM